MADWKKVGWKVREATRCWGIGLTAGVVLASGCMGAEYVVANRLARDIRKFDEHKRVSKVRFNQSAP